MCIQWESEVSFSITLCCSNLHCNLYISMLALIILKSTIGRVSVPVAARSKA